jgi:hypothetical protein
MSGPQSRRQSHQGDGDAQSEQYTQNPRWGGRDEWEGHNLSPEGLGPKAFRGNVRDTCLPKHFWVPSIVVNYNGKTNYQRLARGLPPYVQGRRGKQ